ncbi:hypothetical protein MK805_12495 [Shimazuella sp. AN120528]|uniref:hypothetical protein n=1 Tax=Shimazuella soli TaxID=1892854 RepID=UPI001F10D8A9|nr:hypothetical protein [Shimazuella soli]MCH5585762.1 hypothetical protein [Shimazuella soli]
MSVIKNIYTKEKGLVWTGCTGIVLSLLCVVFYLFYGNEIPPEGEWTKAITFNLAIGIFSLTIAILFPYLKVSLKERKIVIYGLITTFWIAYLIETIQNARGFDPRFTHAGTLFDRLIGIFLGVDSIFIIASLVYFMVLVFRQDKNEYAAVRLAMRYACAALWIGFLSGIWMIVQGVITGPQGEMPNQMVLHFIGFHGLQTISIIGWLMEYMKLPYQKAKQYVHLGGIAWLVLGISLLAQAIAGHDTFDFTPYLVTALIAAAVWFYQIATIGLQIFKNKNENGVEIK